MDIINKDKLLTEGFTYSIKNGKMSLCYFCDCCGHKISATTDIPNKPTNKINKQELFNELMNEMNSKFHECEECNYLVCNNCWENRHEKCKDCPLCSEPISV